MRHPSSAVWLTLLLATFASARAQTVLVVGPGGHPDIQSAVDAAPPGAVIQVQPGTWPAFQTYDKPLTIAGTGPGVVIALAPLSSVTLRLTTGELRLEGLEFRYQGAFDPWTGLFVGGPFQVPACHFVFARCRIGVVFQSSSVNLHLRDCLVTERMIVTESATTLVSSVLRPTTMGLALAVDGGWLHASACTIDSSISSIGIFLRYPLATWLVDCTVIGSAVDGAVRGDTVPPLRTHRCTFVNGIVLSTGSHVPGPLLGIAAPGAAAIGTALPLDFRGEASDLIGVVASFGVGTPLRVPGIEQYPVGMSPAVTLGFLVADAGGRVTLPLSIPNNAALRHLGIHVRGVDLSRSPLQLSPVLPLLVQ